MIDPDDVHLVIDVPAATNPQLCPNPDGALGAFWWSAFLPNSTISGVDAAVWGAPHALAYESTATGPQLWISARFPCVNALGEHPFAYFTRLFAASNITAAFAGYDEAGYVTGTTPATTIPAGTGTAAVAVTPTASLPADTVSVELQLSWTAGATGLQTVLTDFKITAAASAPGAAGIHAPGTVDLGSFTEEVTCTSAGIEVGTLSARLHGHWADPALMTYMRPGRRIRLSVGDRVLWTGTVSDIKPERRKSKKTGVDLLPVVTLTAVDAMAALNVPAPRGAYSIAALPSVLVPAGVPWSILGNTGQRGRDTVAPTNPSATALDQVNILALSNQNVAWAYASPAGVVTVRWVPYTGTTYSDAPTATRPYTHLVTGYSTDTMVNTVTLDDITTDPATRYGPFTNLKSVKEWGARAGRWVSYGMTDAVAAAIARSILAGNGSPSHEPTSMTTYNNTTALQDSAAAQVPSDLVWVLHDGTNYSCRVTTVTHRLKAHADVRRPATWHTDRTLVASTYRPLQLQAPAN